MPGASGRHAARRRLANAGEAHRQLRLWQIAFGVLGGNLLLHQLPQLPPASWLGIAAVVALAVALKCPWLAVTTLAFCWTGWVAGKGLDARWPAESDGEDIDLVGWIDRLPTRDAGRTIFTLRVIQAGTDVPLRRVRLSWYDPAPALAAGQTLAIKARIRSPRGLVNPGGFDYERWLFVERLDATGYVRDGLIEADMHPGLAAGWLRFRARLIDRLGRSIERADAAALIQALALGERGGFEDRHWRVLQRTGTSHLVAVSGLHIGLIAGLSFLLALRLALWLPAAVACRAHSLAAGLCLLPAAVYAALAGFTLPTRRALLMLVVVQLLVFARRRWPAGSGLGIAVVVIVLFDPLATLTASFWLSFGAVALLLAASMAIHRPVAARTVRSRWLARCGQFCRLQWALTLGLAPLVVGFFGQFSIVSLLVNLIAIPVFSIVVVPIALLTALVAAFAADGTTLGEPAGAIAGFAWSALELAAAPRYAAFELPQPPLAAWLLGVAAVVAAVPRHRLPGRSLALLALLPLLRDHSKVPEPGLATATILDVGHGLAVAIETAEHRLLYDTGPSYRSGFDAGEEIVVPALKAIGSRPVDRIIISHGDSDHAGGAASVQAAYPASHALIGPDVDQLPGDVCAAGQYWQWDRVRFSVLHPPADSVLTGNDSSCVVLVATDSGTLLLTGDIEARGESALAGSAGLRADVVVVPHHGSLTSSSAAFVRAVSPDVAIVSAGHNNRWNFPRPEVQRRWLDTGARLLVTGDVGAIRIAFTRDGITVSPARHSRRRYWHAKSDPVSGAFDVSAL